MNIKRAKEDIKNSIKIYLKKDEFGDYRIPVVRQRPAFLIGAPGIGKTAIMEQIAEELGIALVSYSMTHHTRQSALGLPFIQHKTYGDMEYDVSEYTMSEIISSVYETMEKSGAKEGILFLDEINCVSETLAPSMLQFLQYKTFGRHKVPEGWVIVTAGNPPMYNKSVREFDTVTLDRLKVIPVEADYNIWKEYAVERNLNPAILGFLEIRKDFFYHIETTGKGRSFVTARGWEDLSTIITLYEEEGLKVDEELIGEYLRNDTVVKEFAAYYDLYQKYKNDYRVEEILKGNISENAIEKAKAAEFDERLSLLAMLLDKVRTSMKEIVIQSDYLTLLMPGLKALKEITDIETFKERLTLLLEAKEKELKQKEGYGALSKVESFKMKKVIKFLSESRKKTNNSSTAEEAFSQVKEAFDGEVNSMKANVTETKSALTNLFSFSERAFTEGNEMLVLVTELTVNKYSSRYIASFGCEEYHKYNKLLMISERQSDMKENIKKLDILLN